MGTLEKESLDSLKSFRKKKKKQPPIPHLLGIHLSIAPINHHLI